MEIGNPLHEIDPRVDAVYKVIKGNINWDNLVPTCIEAAGEIENFTGMKGKDKLAVLQQALKLAVRESDLDTLQKEEIIHTINTVVPVVVQAAILASKAPIVARVVQATCVTCWKKV